MESEGEDSAGHRLLGLRTRGPLHDAGYLWGAAAGVPHDSHEDGVPADADADTGHADATLAARFGAACFTLQSLS